MAGKELQPGGLAELDVESLPAPRSRRAGRLFDDLVLGISTFTS